MIRRLNVDVVSLCSLREFKRLGFLAYHHMLSGAPVVVMTEMIVLDIISTLHRNSCARVTQHGLGGCFVSLN